MSRITVPSSVNAAPKGAQAALNAVGKSLGLVPNLFRLVGLSPPALKGLLGLTSALSGATLDARTQERIALAVAEINGCGYCLSAHTYLARNVLKLDDAEITANRNATSNDLKAHAAVSFAAALVTHRGHVSDAQVARVAPPVTRTVKSSRSCSQWR